jgi:hypothetical protein
MRDKKELRKELLSQNGMVSGRMSPVEKEELRRLLKRDQARVLRMKRATIIAWLLVPLFMLVGAGLSVIFAGPQGIGTTEAGIAAGWAMMYIAIFFTLSYFWRSRSLGMRQIQATLRDIQEQLERIAGEREKPSDAQ